MENIISMRDHPREEIIAVLDAAEDIKRAIHDPPYRIKFQQKYHRDVSELLVGEKFASLFLEKSTRTNFSMRAAAGSAGAFVDGFTSEEDTSLKKGETWAATAAMFAGYGYSAIGMRSTTEGFPRWTVQYLRENHRLLQAQYEQFGYPFAYSVPFVMNGGDGKNQHPTQCLLDLLTMREVARSMGRELDGLEVALLNDLAHGRTNSSIMSVAHLFGLKLHLAYPPRFGPRPHILEDMVNKGVEFQDHQQDFRGAMMSSLVAYHSRPQKERVGKGEDLVTIKQLGRITRAMYDAMGERGPFLMHPLPVDAETFEEIYHDLDLHEKNITGYQASNGLYVRMALLALGLGKMPWNFPNGKDEVIETTLNRLLLSTKTERPMNPCSGYIRGEGIVIDHIPSGLGRRLTGVLGLEGHEVHKVISEYMPSTRAREKDMIKVYSSCYSLTSEQYEAIALLAPESTISVVQNGRVVSKVRPVLGNTIEGRIICGNEDCVTNVPKEHVTTKHRVESTTNGQLVLRCNYCEITDTVERIYDQQRFEYIENKS